MGPHGGSAYALPGGRGYAELIIAQVPDDPTGIQAVVQVFLLAPDLEARRPMDQPWPNDVRVSLELPDDERIDLDLRLEPDETDPTGVGAARFVSPAGPYVSDQMFGTLRMTVDGQAVEREFSQVQ